MTTINSRLGRWHGKTPSNPAQRARASMTAIRLDPDRTGAAARALTSRVEGLVFMSISAEFTSAPILNTDELAVLAKKVANSPPG